MKKKLTTRQIILLLCLINVAIFSLSYQYIYMKYEKLTEEVNLQTELTRQQITLREQELAVEATQKIEAEQLKSQCNEIIQSFPVYITKEDNLIFIERMENKLKMDIPYVNVSDNVDFYTTILPVRNEAGEEIIVYSAVPEDQTIPEADIPAAEVAETEVAQTEVTETDFSETEQNTELEASAPTEQAPMQQFMKGMQSSININFQTSYKGFKKLVDYINQYPELTSIAEATLSYDGSTGSLMGGMTINRYALTGTGKVYEEPYIGNISIGKDNIFGN